MHITRADVINRLKLDHRAGQGIADEVWLSLARELEAKHSRGLAYLRPAQDKQLRLARLSR